MSLLWNRKTGVVRRESCMFAGTDSVRLLFPASELLRIACPALGTEYQSGCDCSLSPDGRTLKLEPGSRIPHLTERELHPAEPEARFYPAPDANAIEGGIDGRNLLFDRRNFFARHQIEVDYRSDEIDFRSELAPQRDRLPPCRARLARRERLNITVIDKRLLERIVSEAVSGNQYSFTQYVLQQGNEALKIYGYEYKGYVADIKSLQSYYDCSMDLLKPEIRKEMFPTERPVYTKVRDEVPVKYGIDAVAKNAMIADGCVIEGTVENSIIFRGVKIGRGAVVKNSIIMQGTYVGENCLLDCVITDKDVMIRDSKKLIGCKEYPFFIEKGTAV